MPRLEYDVVFNIDTSSVETLEQNLNNVSSGGGSKAIEQTEKDVQGLNTQLERTSVSADEARQALQGVSSGTTQLQSGMQNVNNQQETFNKTANNSNQILFSFGDAMQDSAQFSNGFSSGMRAVGNNLTFASEQISIMVAKAGSGKAAMQSLAGAMLGPAGLVFGINTLVTVITLWSQSANRATKETEQLTDEVVSFADEASSIGRDLVFDPLGVIAKGDKIQQLKNVENELASLFDLRDQADNLRSSLSGIEAEMAKTSVTSGGLAQQFQRVESTSGDLSEEQRRISGLLRDTNAQISEQEDIFGELSNVQRQQIQDKIDDAKASQALKNALVELNPTLRLQRDISEELSPAIRDLNLGLENSEESVRNLHNEYQNQIDALRAQNSLTEQEKDQLFTLTEARDELRAAVKDYIEEQEGSFAVTRRQQVLLEQMGLSAKETKEELKALSEELPQQERSFIPDAPAQKSIANLKSQISAMESFRNKLDLSTREGVQGYNELTRAIQRTKNEIDDLTGSAGEQSSVLSKEFSQAFGAISQGASQLASALTDLTTTQIEGRIRAAEAAGASAEKIEQLERERFEARKKGALANAVINTAQGVTNALGSLDPPWSFVQAGLVAAAGAVQVAAIKAQEFGGGTQSGGSSVQRATQGFNTSEINTSRPDADTAKRERQPIQNNITLAGEFDDRMVSVKAERGDRKRRGRAVSIQSD